MANIFNFPSRRKAKAPAEQDFLQPDSELLQFNAQGVETDIPDSPELAPLASPNDWTNQESASIYRVKRLLDAAGVPCHLERGLSDEGDPWCIFCTPMGEVFIHLSRIDGMYVLDSPNLQKPIFGDSFTTLIDEFSSGALKGSEQAAQARRRLIRLERSGNVFLHPATLLAALIWSIYLNTEELVFFVPEEEDGGDADVALAHVAGASEAQNMEDAALEAAFVHAVAQPDQVISAHLPVMGLAESDSKAGFPLYKEIIAKSGMVVTPTAMALGLSSIAIAYGFMAEGYFEEDSTVQADLSLPEAEVLDVELAEGPSTPQAPQSQPGFDLTAALSGVVAQLTTPAPEDLPLLDENAATVDISQLLTLALATPAAVTAPQQGTGAQRVLEASDDGKLAMVQPATLDTLEEEDSITIVTVDASEPLSEDADVLDVPAVSNALFSLADLKDSFASQLTEFSFGDTLVLASFDIASLSEETARILDATVGFDMPAVTPTVSVAPDNSNDLVAQLSLDDDIRSTRDILADFFQRPMGETLLDDNAISFVTFLMGKDSNVQIISREDEIVFIDFGALDQPAGEILAMSWELEHGGTVQTVGLRSDFIEFDLIA